MRRLTTIEKDIKKMLEEDFNNPDVYPLILELSHLWLMRNKILFNSEDAYEVAVLMSEDLYLKREKVISWIGYISKSYRRYVDEWLKVQPQIVDASENEPIEKLIIQMSAGSALDNNDISEIYTADYLRTLPKVVDGLLEDSKFYRDTREFLNSKITLMLSLKNGKFTRFGLSEIDANYVKVLYRILMDRIKIDLHLNEEVQQGYSLFLGEEDEDLDGLT